jgi:hypothetical protein
MHTIAKGRIALSYNHFYCSNKLGVDVARDAVRNGVRNALLLGAVSIGQLSAQSTAAKPAAAAPAASPAGFAIETEMLTYRALESNSEAIACDVAAYLNGGTAAFTDTPKGKVCAVKAGARKNTVVLLPFDNSQLTDFQIWRADMATMERLQRKARDLDCPRTSRGAATAATSVMGTLLAGSPAGPPLALAQSALALMASEESTSPVVGTVQDQAFMDGIGRELRALNVTLVMPTAYTPFAVSPLSHNDSPFLASYDRTLAAQECLAELPANEDPKSKKAKGLLADIAAFFATLTAPPPSSGATAPKTATPPAPAENSPAPTKPASAPTHLIAVLSADGLAQKLGVDAATGEFGDAAAYTHILLVKALESGGAVSRRSNVLGVRVRYSGGSVGTYALFQADGELECSGNVYDYAGSASAKEFQKDLRNFNPEPDKQIIFLHGGCSASRSGH